MFSVIFVLCVQFALPVYTAQKEYESYEINRDSFSGTDFNSYNASANWAFNWSASGNVRNTLNGHIIEFRVGARELYGAFSIIHVTWEFSIFQNIETLACSEVKGDSVYDGLTKEQILTQVYDNASDTAQMTFSCSHITLRVSLSACIANETFKSALLNGHAYHVEVFYDVDFSQMGVGIWNILGSIFAFQAIQTGNLQADLLINSLITIPLYVGFGYVLYRLITGLIPTLSGGGGA